MNTKLTRLAVYDDTSASSLDGCAAMLERSSRSWRSEAPGSEDDELDDPAFSYGISEISQSSS